MPDTVTGQITDDGRARIEDEDNPDAWIEAEYRDGWVERKLQALKLCLTPTK